MRKVKTTDYVAEKLSGGIFATFLALGQTHAVEEVELEYFDYSKGHFGDYGLYGKDGHQLIGGFGSHIKEIQGAMLLSDGRVMTCISSKEGGDTFHSGELEVNYYMLTPK